MKKVLVWILCLLICFSFGAAGIPTALAETVSEIDVSNVYLPQAGTGLSNFPTCFPAQVPEGAPYVIRAQSWSINENGSTKGYGINTSFANPITVFEAGKTYTYTAGLFLNDGYTLDSSVTATVNGQTARTHMPNDHVVWVSFDYTVSQTVEDVTVLHVTLPNAQEGAVFTADTLSYANYEVVEECWRYGTAQYVYSTQTSVSNPLKVFEAGKTYIYTATLRIRPGAGTTFSAKSALTGQIAGAAAKIVFVSDVALVIKVERQYTVPLDSEPVQYAIHYDANGGSGTMDDSLQLRGRTIEVPSCGFTAPMNSAFKGWCSNAQGDDWIYSAGENIEVSDETTLYAVWQNTALKGDVNSDGRINTTDALLTLRAAVQKITFTAAQITLADVNGDGRINTTDALMILRKAVNPAYVFPA